MLAWVRAHTVRMAHNTKSPHVGSARSVRSPYFQRPEHFAAPLPTGPERDRLRPERGPRLHVLLRDSRRRGLLPSSQLVSRGTGASSPSAQPLRSPQIKIATSSLGRGLSGRDRGSLSLASSTGAGNGPRSSWTASATRRGNGHVGLGPQARATCVAIVSKQAHGHGPIERGDRPGPSPRQVACLGVGDPRDRRAQHEGGGRGARSHALEGRPRRSSPHTVKGEGILGVAPRPPNNKELGARSPQR